VKSQLKYNLMFLILLRTIQKDLFLNKPNSLLVYKKQLLLEISITD
jgi:hypothetical protein